MEGKEVVAMFIVVASFSPYTAIFSRNVYSGSLVFSLYSDFGKVMDSCNGGYFVHLTCEG